MTNQSTDNDYLEEPASAPTKKEGVPVEPAVQNVEFTNSPFSKRPEGVQSWETIRVPSGNNEKAQEAIRKLPNLTTNPTYVPDQATREWVGVIDQAASMSPADSVAEDALGRPGSVWRQSIDHAGSTLAGGYPKFRPNATTELTGEAAVSRLRAYRGLGNMYRVPLWNSGFWITLTAPTEPEMIELHRLIAADRAQLGRRSYGMSFTSTTGIYADRILAFAIEHIYKTTVKIKPETDIRSLIKCTDIPTIAMAIAATKWPSGFDYERACMCDPENCKHVVKERIDITKLLLVDTSNLTQWQIAHMSKMASDSVEEADVLRYQEETAIAQTVKYQLDKDSQSPVEVSFRVPTALQYIQSSHRWINDITTMVDRALTKDTSNDQRNAYLLTQGQATSLRMYNHWVKSLSYGDVATTDLETIEQNMDTISGDDVLRGDFHKYVQEYIAASTLTVVGVPSFTCPVCKKDNESPNPHPTIKDAIPIDVYQVFFEVIAQRIRRISER